MVFHAGAQACPETPKAVAQMCSVKNVFVQICRHLNFIKKEALAQMFSCEFCKISKSTFFYRTLLVVAPETRPLKAEWYKVLQIIHYGISPTR